MPQVTKPFAYTGSTQRIVINEYVVSPLVLHLWGAGGGGGSGDGYGRGGTGGGGGYSLATIPVTVGDVIDIAVGGAGERGYTGGGGRGGVGGSSYQAAPFVGAVFDTRTTASPVPVYNMSNNIYCAFLNATGIWNTPTGLGYSFNNTYTVNFPQNGVYRIEGSCDDYASVYLDGDQVLDIQDYSTSISTDIVVYAGNHTVSFTAGNTGGKGAIGIRITQISSLQCFCGSTGGRAGYAGGSGGGGGAGGATVVLKNGNIVAVAGGGGGGGGAGQYAYVSQCDAPGLAVLAGPGTYSGMNGQDKDGDGGGGAGGGGYQGGNGGAQRGGDVTAFGGANGSSYTVNGSTQSAAGQVPGGTSDPFYVAGTGIGGNYGGYPGPQAPTSGTPGYAVLEFTVGSLSIKDAGTWRPVSKAWVKNSGTWSEIKGIYVKENGVWKLIQGQENNLPAPTPIGRFGYAPRAYSP